MLVGGVVYHEVHKDTQTSLVSAVKHLLKDVEFAVVGVDVFVVGNIVAVVGVRGRVER